MTSYLWHFDLDCLLFPRLDTLIGEYVPDFFGRPGGLLILLYILQHLAYSVLNVLGVMWDMVTITKEIVCALQVFSLPLAKVGKWLGCRGCLSSNAAPCLRLFTR